MSLKHYLLLLLITLLTACATLTPNYEKPQVTIRSFSLAQSNDGFTPLFDIGLRIINPNPVALPLTGMSYSVEVEDKRILSGVQADLPKIEAYSTADINIQASPDLLASIRLINQLLSRQQSSFSYAFNAKIDLGTLIPYITLKETGEFEMSGF